MKRIVICVWCLLALSCLKAQTPLTTAVDFTITDTHGQPHSLFTYLDSGKYVVLDFFYVSCLACQATAPAANASYEHFGCNRGGVVFLGLDYGDSNSQVQYFESFFGVNYPCASGTQGGGDTVNTAYGISSYPCYILIAPDRNIVIQDINPFTETDCNNAIESYGVTPMPCSSGTETADAQTSSINLITYPNPSTTVLSVAFSSFPENFYTLEILDPAGRSVAHSGNIGSGKNRQVFEFSLMNIATGMYFIKLSENGNCIACKRCSVIR